jgi:hypothetical protein
VPANSARTYRVTLGMRLSNAVVRVLLHLGIRLGAMALLTVKRAQDGGGAHDARGARGARP